MRTALPGCQAVGSDLMKRVTFDDRCEQPGERWLYRSKRASSMWIEGSFVTSGDFGGSSEPSGACSAHRMR